MSAQQAPAAGAGAAAQAPSTARGAGGGRRAATNGRPGGTEIKQNTYVNRPLTNEGMSSNPVRYL